MRSNNCVVSFIKDIFCTSVASQRFDLSPDPVRIRFIECALYLKTFVSSLVTLVWVRMCKCVQMLAAGPARCGLFVLLWALCGCAVIALDIGPKNSEANRSEQSCMDTCHGEGGTWDEMCERIRDWILMMPDHESEVGENVLRHFELDRLSHKNDCEFRPTLMRCHHHQYQQQQQLCCEK